MEFFQWIIKKNFPPLPLQIWHACLLLCAGFIEMAEKEIAAHSSVLAWRIPGMGEPGGLPSMGSHRVGQDWSVLGAAGVIH